MPARKSPLKFQHRRAPGAHHDPEILKGMARGPWADHWATEQEEQGESFSGMDIYELAPDAPNWAEKWAQHLADAIMSLNKRTLEELYKIAQQAGFSRDREAFGFYLGMQSIGHGITWHDDFNTDVKILLPSGEFYEGAKPDLRFVH